jgi:hypothetical protein
MKTAQELLEDIKDLSFPEVFSLYEMTGVTSKYSGLKQHIWISPKGGAQHGPRIKVSNVPGTFSANDSFSVSIEDEPRVRVGTVRIKQEDLEDIKDWIRLNRDFLLKVWKSDSMGSDEHLEGLKKL